MFTPILGEDSHFDEHIFQMGWFNHQLVFDRKAFGFLGNISTILGGFFHLMDISPAEKRFKQKHDPLVVGKKKQKILSFPFTNLLQMLRVSLWLNLHIYIYTIYIYMVYIYIYIYLTKL